MKKKEAEIQAVLFVVVIGSRIRRKLHLHIQAVIKSLVS